jgi:mono/diheme cytochrome c family protein
MTYVPASRLPLFAGSLLAVAALAACYTGGSVADDSAAVGASGASPTALGAVAGDLPCDVAQVLSDSCASCHGSPLGGGAPNRLLSYSDLVAPAASNASLREIDAAILRMKDSKSPMPPSGLVPAGVAVLEQWVAGGLPKGTCGGAGSSFDTPSVCTSGRTSTRGEGPTMAPGQACVACHSRGEGPRYSIAGTVYPTAHEPDNCLGSPGGVSVVITGADGAVVTLPVNSAGNFSLRTRVATPYTAKVVAGGKVRVMATPQTNGDCNACHTQAGTSLAPGRVVAP